MRKPIALLTVLLSLLLAAPLSAQETPLNDASLSGLSLRAIGPALNSGRPLLFGIAVLLVGCGLTYVLFVGARDQHDRPLGHEFSLETNEIYQRLQRSIDWHVDILNGLAGLYGASTEVTESEFLTFIRPSFDRQPNIGMLGWAPRAGPGEWAERTAELRSAGIGGSVDPATGRPYPNTPDRDVFPVLFSRSGGDFLIGRGEDLSGVVEHRLAMAWARDSTSSGRLSPRRPSFQALARSP